MSRVYAGTGSRELILDPETMIKVRKTLVSMIKSVQANVSDPKMICGGAEGFDEALALACIETKMPFVLALPNDGYGQYYWGEHSLLKRNRIKEFEHIMDKANKIKIVCQGIYEKGRHSNLVRNEWMVDNCDKLWVYNLDTPGTRSCVAYAKKVNRAHYFLPIV